jgi:hypothetical protein
MAADIQMDGRTDGRNILSEICTIINMHAHFYKISLQRKLLGANIRMSRKFQYLRGPESRS